SLDDPVRAGGDAVAAAVADVVLHHDGAELGVRERAGRAHVEARRVRAVLAHVRLHEPPEVGGLPRVARLPGRGRRGQAVVDRGRGLDTSPEPGTGTGVRGRARRGEVGRYLLLDDRHVPPRGRAERAGVVVRIPGELEAVLG